MQIRYRFKLVEMPLHKFFLLNAELRLSLRPLEKDMRLANQMIVDFGTHI